MAETTVGDVAKKVTDWSIAISVLFSGTTRLMLSLAARSVATKMA